MKRILQSSFVLYCLIAALMFVLIREEKVVHKNLDYLQAAPEIALNFARGREFISDEKNVHLKLVPSLRYYKNLNQMFPESAVALSNIAYSYYFLGEPERAIQYYRQAVEKKSEIFGLDHNLAVLYYQQGQFEKAASVLQNAINISPSKSLLYPQSVDPYTSLVDGYTADPKQLKLKSLEIGYRKAHQLLVLSYNALKDYQAMKKAAQAGLLNTSEAKEFFHLHIGLAEMKLENTQKALQIFQQYVKHFPQRPEGYHYLALSLTQIGKSDLAATLRARAVELSFSEDIIRKMQDVATELYFYPTIRIVTAQGKLGLL